MPSARVKIDARVSSGYASVRRSPQDLALFSMTTDRRQPHAAAVGLRVHQGYQRCPAHDAIGSSSATPRATRNRDIGARAKDQREHRQ
jgi:hypothetical protein